MPPGNKPLLEPVLNKISNAIYGVTRPQWVKSLWQRDGFLRMSLRFDAKWYGIHFCMYLVATLLTYRAIIDLIPYRCMKPNCDLLCANGNPPNGHLMSSSGCVISCSWLVNNPIYDFSMSIGNVLACIWLLLFRVSICCLCFMVIYISKFWIESPVWHFSLLLCLASKYEYSFALILICLRCYGFHRIN